MKINLDNLSPNIRDLQVSLKLENKAHYSLPMANDGYIINPRKFEKEVENIKVDFQDIKNLLLMMVNGNKEFIDTLVKTDSNRFVDTQA